MEFSEFLKSHISQSKWPTEDLLAIFLPLARQVAEQHSIGKVAPFSDLSSLRFQETSLQFLEQAFHDGIENEKQLGEVESRQPRAFEVTSTRSRVRETGAGQKIEGLDIHEENEPITRPIFCLGYEAWESRLGHHDPLADIFSLGMLLASLSCGLDFRRKEDLAKFIEHRQNLFQVNAELHPVLAHWIIRLTELSRPKRWSNLKDAIRAIENYREQSVDIEAELGAIPGFVVRDIKSKQALILQRLKRRLFDLTRRNRLLQFQPTALSINLTQASIPLSFNPSTIRPESLLIWNETLHQAVRKGEVISLNKYSDFAQHIYLPSQIERLLLDVKRDQAEFGLVQLRLVICFLHWADLKTEPAERYDSPLLLLPVTLQRKKGVRDQFTLEFSSDCAEVNPVIRHLFQQNYGIELPELVDLSESDTSQFFEFLQAQIRKTEPAVMLQMIDRPQVDLVLEKAKRRLDQFQRRSSQHKMRNEKGIDYSYDPSRFRPRGLEIFKAKLTIPATALEHLKEDRDFESNVRGMASEETGGEKTNSQTGAQTATSNESDGASTIERKGATLYVREGGSENPYLWTYDLCNVTLANFRYRKMSLVRDYEKLLEDTQANPVFDRLFSLATPDEKQPAVSLRQLASSRTFESRFEVLPADPTQVRAISVAETGQSYIIQGPPGTGKSQTIANLIADYVARGKRVLFVCEKRAAIDVVYARLRQKGMARLACLIHDSQADKKEFVLNLKEVFEHYQEEKEKSVSRKRSSLQKRLHEEASHLKLFESIANREFEYVGCKTRTLIEEAIRTRGVGTQLTSREQERVPSYRDFLLNRDLVRRLFRTLSDISPGTVLAQHPLRRLSIELVAKSKPIDSVTSSVEKGLPVLRELLEMFAEVGLPEEYFECLGRLDQIIKYCEKIEELAKLDRMRLLDEGSQVSQSFSADFRQVHEALEKLAEVRQDNAFWVKKISRRDATIALDYSKSWEKSWAPWLSFAWWKIRSVMSDSCDFRRSTIRPTWRQALESLLLEYDRADLVKQIENSVGAALGLPADLIEFEKRLLQTRSETQNLPLWLGKFHTWLVRENRPHRYVKVILDAKPLLVAIRQALGPVLDPFDEVSLTELAGDLSRMDEALDDLPQFMKCLHVLRELPIEMREGLRELPLSEAEFEGACIRATLNRVLSEVPDFAVFEGADRDRHAESLGELWSEYLSLNSQEVNHRVQENFLEIYRRSLERDKGPNSDAESLKGFQRGVKDLDREFKKSIRFRPIRDLVNGDSQNVVQRLKPVWLMSPLSVSDALPLQSNFFDVIIFDEASQIPLEEAIPALFRAPQAIIVGDQMQLPPTDFFGVRREDDDEKNEASEEESGEESSYVDLNALSFLNQAAKNLESFMLGWHYRSQSESLISYSNWAFYQGELLTAPEERIPGLQAVADDQIGLDTETQMRQILDKPLSFCHLRGAVYDNRTNRAEADFIAKMIREVLRKRKGLSIAVIAFSEAQQQQIEAALTELADQDSDFRELLDAEFDRNEDGQFVGLLVKNLENIQGDERDVVILSVCYGPNPKGKVLMNFGPINKAGGEKRLNVAFSRAKKHMVIVSSIFGDQITNDYNEGARHLKNYLKYAEAISAEDWPNAERILRSVNRRQSLEKEASSAAHIVIEELSNALTERGWKVELNVGQSQFRCDLAVAAKSDTNYRLGILIDGDNYYQQEDLLEREVQRPALLRAFGWKVAIVLSKDWLLRKDEVLNRIESTLLG